MTVVLAPHTTVPAPSDIVDGDVTPGFDTHLEISAQDEQSDDNLDDYDEFDVDDFDDDFDDDFEGELEDEYDIEEDFQVNPDGSEIDVDLDEGESAGEFEDVDEDGGVKPYVQEEEDK